MKKLLLLSCLSLLTIDTASAAWVPFLTKLNHIAKAVDFFNYSQLKGVLDDAGKGACNIAFHEPMTEENNFFLFISYVRKVDGRNVPGSDSIYLMDKKFENYQSSNYSLSFINKEDKESYNTSEIVLDIVDGKAAQYTITFMKKGQVYNTVKCHSLKSK